MIIHWFQVNVGHVKILKTHVIQRHLCRKLLQTTNRRHFELRKASPDRTYPECQTENVQDRIVCQYTFSTLSDLDSAGVSGFWTLTERWCQVTLWLAHLFWTAARWCEICESGAQCKVCTVHSAQFAVHSVQCTLHTAHCTLPEKLLLASCTSQPSQLHNFTSMQYHPIKLRF